MANSKKEAVAKKETAPSKDEKKDTVNAESQKKASDKKPAKAKKRKVEITGGVAFLGLPWNVGQTPELDEKQAEAVVDAKRGNYID